MERENQTDQITFGSAEKEILNIMAEFENQLNSKLKESNSSLEQVKYYEHFQIEGIKKLDFSDIFISTEKDDKGRLTYHMYCKDISDEILSIDSEGNKTIKPELEAFLGNINLEELMLENENEPGRLRGVSERLNPKEIEKMKLRKENEKDEAENEESEEAKLEKVQEDLSEDEDLEIIDYKKIEDPKLDSIIEEKEASCEEKGIAYSKKQGTYIMLVKKDGKFKRAEGFKDAIPTSKKVYNIDENYSQTEKVPHALMQTSKENQEISITIDQYGYIETGIVDKLDSGVRIETQAKKQQGKDPIIDNKDKEGTRSKETINEDILLASEAEKDKVSVEEFRKYFYQTTGENIMERIEETHEIIEQQYRNLPKNR